jgi:hypothetical protein
MDTASDDNNAEEGDSGQSLVIQGKSGISYDLAGLDPDSEARALVGLTSEFEVISCTTTETGYDFQLLERPRVHLNHNAYTCTCSTFASRPDVACQHIFVSPAGPLHPPDPRTTASADSCPSGSSTSCTAVSSRDALPRKSP